MDYNHVADLIDKVSQACTTFTMAVDSDGLVSFYVVPRWEKEEGYYLETNFRVFEIEAKLDILEQLLWFVNDRVCDLKLVRGKMSLIRKKSS